MHYAQIPNDDNWIPYGGLQCLGSLRILKSEALKFIDDTTVYTRVRRSILPDLEAGSVAPGLLLNLVVQPYIAPAVRALRVV